jgi:hypothetical protein
MMEIPLDTFLLMASGSEYFLKMQDFEDRLQERVNTKTIKVDIPLVPFANSEDMIAIME